MSSKKIYRKAAFIVKGPPTYMNAEEAWSKYWNSRSNTVLIILVPMGNPHNRVERLKSVIDSSLWERIVWVFLKSNVRYKKDNDGSYVKFKRSFVKKIYGYVYDVILLNRVSKQIGNCDLVFSGHNDVQEHLAYKLNPKQLFLLDSGMTVLRRITNTGYIDYRNEISKKILTIMNILGYKIFDRTKTSLFTSYDSIKTKHRIFKNEHDRKRIIILKKPKTNKIYWISSPMIEYFGVTLDAYVDYIRASVQSIDYKTKDIVYIPHTGKEADENIKKVVNILGCDLDNRLLPVEIKITKNHSLPFACISPYSSSLSNLASFVGDEIQLYSAWHYEFKCFSALNKWRYTIQNNKKNNIKIIEIKECKALFGIDKIEDCKNKYNTFHDFIKKAKNDIK